MREKDFQKQVEQAAAFLGWRCFHFPNMQMNPAGFPDLLCFKDGRTEIMELKNEKGRLGPRQIETIDELRTMGMSVNIFRPDDWPAIEALLKGDAA